MADKNAAELEGVLKRLPFYSLLIPRTPIQKLWTAVRGSDIDRYCAILNDTGKDILWNEAEAQAALATASAISFLPDWEWRERMVLPAFEALSELEQQVLILCLELEGHVSENHKALAERLNMVSVYQLRNTRDRAMQKIGFAIYNSPAGKSFYREMEKDYALPLGTIGIAQKLAYTLLPPKEVELLQLREAKKRAPFVIGTVAGEVLTWHHNIPFQPSRHINEQEVAAELQLSTRLMRLIMGAKIKDLENLLSKSYEEFDKIRLFGVESFREINGLRERYGLPPLQPPA